MQEEMTLDCVQHTGSDLVTGPFICQRRAIGLCPAHGERLSDWVVHMQEEMPLDGVQLMGSG